MTRPSDTTAEPNDSARQERRLVVCLTADSPIPVLEDAVTPDQTVVYVPSVEAATDSLSDGVDCVLVDSHADGDPHVAIERIAERNGPPVVFLARDEDADSVRRAFDHGAVEAATGAVPAALAQRLRRVVEEYRAGDPSDDLLDQFHDGLFVLDDDLRVEYWNESFAEVTGLTNDQAVGAALFELWPAVEGTPLGDALTADAAGDVVRVTPTIPPLDETEVAVHHGPGGVAVHVQTVGSRTRRDAALLEQFLSGLMDETGDTVYFKDDESRFVRVSRSKAREVETTREEIIGKSDFDFMTETEARKRYENEQRIMESGTPYRDDSERVVTPDGDVRWFQTVKLPRYDERGNVVGTLGLSRDITELKALEETLSELERLVDRMPVWLLSLDGTDVVTWANEAASDSLAEPDGDLVGTGLAELVGDGPLESAFHDEYAATVERLLSDGTDDAWRAVIHDVALSLPGDRRRICNVHVRLLPTAEGRDRGTVVAFHDVTTQREQERALERQYERLERLVQTVTHDLRNPLTVALGHVEYSRETRDDEPLSKALSSLERMDTLIDELLSMAEVGQTVEDPVPVSLAAIAEDAWEAFDDEPATLRISGDTTITADPGRLMRLFENLFRNAIDHAGPDSTVTVGVIEEGFFVSDDGAGISADEREQVFDHGYTTAHLGTGFGLTIVDEIVSAHGWSIAITDGDAGGARFEILTDRQ